MSSADMFNMATDYVEAELSLSIKEYEFLTKLNDAACKSFTDYRQVADKISRNVDKINSNQEAKARLAGLIESIDKIDRKVTALESLAFKIDAYSKRLETTFKELDQKSTKEQQPAT